MGVVVAALPPSLAESLWLSGGAFLKSFEALPRRYPEAEPQIKTKPLGKPEAFRKGWRQSRDRFFPTYSEGGGIPVFKLHGYPVRHFP